MKSEMGQPKLSIGKLRVLSVLDLNGTLSINQLTQRCNFDSRTSTEYIVSSLSKAGLVKAKNGVLYSLTSLGQALTRPSYSNVEQKNWLLSRGYGDYIGKISARLSEHAENGLTISREDRPRTALATKPAAHSDVHPPKSKTVQSPPSTDTRLSIASPSATTKSIKLSAPCAKDINNKEDVMFTIKKKDGLFLTDVESAIVLSVFNAGKLSKDGIFAVIKQSLSSVDQRKADLNQQAVLSAAVDRNLISKRLSDNDYELGALGLAAVGDGEDALLSTLESALTQRNERLVCEFIMKKPARYTSAKQAQALLSAQNPLEDEPVDIEALLGGLEDRDLLIRRTNGMHYFTKRVQKAIKAFEKGRPATLGKPTAQKDTTALPEQTEQTELDVVESAAPVTEPAEKDVAKEPSSPTATGVSKAMEAVESLLGSPKKTFPVVSDVDAKVALLTRIGELLGDADVLSVLAEIGSDLKAVDAFSKTD
jgi:predicted transcriptional regulator